MSPTDILKSEHRVIEQVLDCLEMIAADADRVVIVDWKTERRRAAREQLRHRLQTRVYRYVVTVVQGCTPDAVQIILTDIKKENWAEAGKLFSD